MSDDKVVSTNFKVGDIVRHAYTVTCWCSRKEQSINGKCAARFRVVEGNFVEVVSGHFANAGTTYSMENGTTYEFVNESTESHIFRPSGINVGPFPASEFVPTGFSSRLEWRRYTGEAL